MADTNRLPLLSRSLIATRPRRSLCMIVRNEEENLGACLESVADLMDEIVVVDTGSTDRTRAVARRFGARVFDFPWVDSFAAARNESLRHATGDWIFWLDADERVIGANRTKLQRLFAGLGQENKAYGMRLVFLPEPGSMVTTEGKHVRLFRHHPELRWQDRIYEKIMPALHAVGASVEWTDIAVHHLGYQDPGVLARKCERNLRLLQMDYAEDADNPATLFAIGCIYVAMGRPADALPMLQRGLERRNADESLGRGLSRLIVECHRLLGQTPAALAACCAARASYPLDAGLRSQEAQLREELGDLAGAESCYLHLLREQEANSGDGLPAGVLDFWARHQLAALYAKQGRIADAKAQWPALKSGTDPVLA
jgi:tetratricopeptide (TPR) repeat protein